MSVLLYSRIHFLWDFQWLRLHASNAGDIGSIPSQGSHMPHCVAKKKKKKKEKAYFDHSNDLLMLYIKCSNKEY